MKFFTPDLIARASSDNDAIADAAHDEWEMMRTLYRKHLRDIRPKLSKSIRKLLREFRLHDARLKWLAEGADRPCVVMVVQLDTPSGDDLQLIYNLCEKPEAIRHPSLAEPETPLEWLYDEIDAEKSDKGTVFTHSILFTSGYELRLKFKNLRLAIYQKSNLIGSGEDGPVGLATSSVGSEDHSHA